jgi:hypothetical protein
MSVAGIGVCVRGLTRRVTRWAGKRESRDMAKTSREHAVMTAVPAPDHEYQSQRRGRYHRSDDCAWDAAVRVLSLLGKVRRGVEADEGGEAHDRDSYRDDQHD